MDQFKVKSPVKNLGRPRKAVDENSNGFSCKGRFLDYFSRWYKCEGFPQLLKQLIQMLKRSFRLFENFQF